MKHVRRKKKTQKRKKYWVKLSLQTREGIDKCKPKQDNLLD